jgi:small-conductance mechanosensitive channel
MLAVGSKESTQQVQSLLGTGLDLGGFALLFWLVFRLTRVLDRHLGQWAARSSNKLYNLLFPLIGASLRRLLPVLGVMFSLPLVRLPARYLALLDKATSIFLIAAMALIAFQVVKTFERALLLRYDLEASDNLRARTVYTQVKVIGKMLDVVVALLAVASILMLFSEVRHVGASLLASAGIVGIIAGVAAQKTLANLLAGFQIALAQPIRQDDVLVVEGEWGRVEEITLTYVVLHIWDDRRMVLPLTYFIEKPFQNWTRVSAQLLGAIKIWVDYSFPVEAGRRALKQIIEEQPLWDRRFWNLQVTDADAKAMQLRILVTAGDSSAAWDLRCAVREQFIDFIQREHPHVLPRVRAELIGESGDSGRAARQLSGPAADVQPVRVSGSAASNA